VSDYPRYRWCRHHKKPKPMVDECALGIDLTKHVGKFGSAYMLPCHDQSKDGIAKDECAHRSFFTDAEIAEQDAESDRCVAETMRRLNVIAPLVERLRKDGKGRSGTEPCPVCGDGEVSWRVDSWNGHLAMRCSTTDCIAFME